MTESPIARMKPPHVPDEPVPVLGDDELRRLLAACEGKGFEERRDTAIVRLFLDTGLRLAELANLRLEDLDLDQDVAIVVGKGRRPRARPFGSTTGQAIDRYLRCALSIPISCATPSPPPGSALGVTPEACARRRDKS